MDQSIFRRNCHVEVSETSGDGVRCSSAIWPPEHIYWSLERSVRAWTTASSSVVRARGMKRLWKTMPMGGGTLACLAYGAGA